MVSECKVVQFLQNWGAICYLYQRASSFVSLSEEEIVIKLTRISPSFICVGCKEYLLECINILVWILLQLWSWIPSTIMYVNPKFAFYYTVRDSIEFLWLYKISKILLLRKLSDIIGWMNPVDFFSFLFRLILFFI